MIRSPPRSKNQNQNQTGDTNFNSAQKDMNTNFFPRAARRTIAVTAGKPVEWECPVLVRGEPEFPLPDRSALSPCSNFLSDANAHHPFRRFIGGYCDCGIDRCLREA